MDTEDQIHQHFINGDIDYTDAVIRLTSVIDDAEWAQAIVDHWVKEKSDSEQKASYIDKTGPKTGPKTSSSNNNNDKW